MTAEEPVEEGFVMIDGTAYYAIPDVDQMAPFLMSVVSDGDRWMFVSSSGALTAGRADVAGAVFPYDTDDQLHSSAGVVGPTTAIRFGDGTDQTWTPFDHLLRAPGHRNLYKSVIGDSVIFEEVHPGSQLRFRYRWASGERFGFVRTATLINDSEKSIRAELVDGVVNILPFGLEPGFYQSMSNLSNAYKRSEIIDPTTRLAVFSLESRIVDRPEPAEVLRSTVVWSVGLDTASVSVSPDTMTGFLSCSPGEEIPRLTGRPGAYLLHGNVDLDPGAQQSWHIVIDASQDQIAVARLRELLQTERPLQSSIRASLGEASSSLVEIMAPADAVQRTGDRVATAHQFANVTYNVMRGGVPLSGYRIATSDFVRFVTERNRKVADRHETWFQSLPETIRRSALLTHIADNGDPHLMRLCLEYLPFSFSRRHGDPSRPWNAFSIRVRDAAGEPIVHYEGNWRDIFQNWEALCMSFPEYLPGIISVFVNASTTDGFNPYRITRHGIDWEVPDPNDPWSNIGYWGDHQIVYLLRLLEASDQFFPGEVGRLLSEPWFTYADVPYRLVPYDDLVADPKATIRYDEAAAVSTAVRAGEVGNDGKLLTGDDGEPQLVTLLEKLLVPALSKLSNFVPHGGIWMNTQRPEWNDANNALVGYGLSMVTLYHLRRYVDHLRTLIAATVIDEVAMSAEVVTWLADITSALQQSRPSGEAPTEPSRKQLMDRLGQAFSQYRAVVYSSGLSDPISVEISAVAQLCDIAIEHLDDTIRHSRRTDGLYQSYNLIRLAPDGSEASVEHLQEMLEGQVAILSSGVLTGQERIDVIDALFASDMYRADQHSFMLYPAAQLPSFLDKNVVPTEAVHGNPLLAGLLAAGDRSVIAVDTDGRYRLNADFSNVSDLETALDVLTEDSTWSDLVTEHRETTLLTYEQVFGHHSYTGRSGSMYGYEGIGSIYWHMVAKLLLAVQESTIDAVRAGASPATVTQLTDAYRRVRIGLGFNKTAKEFGAIPTDPYSHTPAHAGAQQPGMTGLVKEELLTRLLEVGVRIEAGEIVFDPVLLSQGELLDHPESWAVYDLDLEPSTVELDADSLGMTLCQVPVIVSTTSGDPRVEVTFAEGSTQHVPGLTLDSQTSAKVFARSGEVTLIHAYVPAAAIHRG